jgi:hypothetical protein
MKSGGSISIWFFIGVSLFVNGLLIFASGIYELIHPPETPVVLFNLHASVWWGAALAIFGGFYTFYFFPKRTKG